MKTIHNILTKILLILCLAVGWGSTAWSERFEPTFVASYSPTSTSWYYFKFENSSAFLYSKATGENFSFKANETQNPAFMWQLVGTSAEFRLVSLTGQYAYWKGSELSGTDDASQAATFKLIDGSDADSYSVQKSGASGTSDCLNPQSSVVRTYSRDNGCRVRFSAPTSADLAAAQEAITVYELHNVNLVFKDAGGNTLTGASVTYTPSNGDPAVTLDATQSAYDFKGEVYSPTLFSATSDYTLGKVSYDDENSTLSFLLSPHALPTGVYRMASSKEDRGYFIDKGDYITVGRNKWQTSSDVADATNSLWYVNNNEDGSFCISSLSTMRGTDHVPFLKGVGNGTSYELDSPALWYIVYNTTAARTTGNWGEYDRTMPTADFFSVKQSAAASEGLSASPGYANEWQRAMIYDVNDNGSFIEFQPYAESLITDAGQLALLALTKAMLTIEPLDGTVSLRFVDENDKPTTITTVTYHPSNGGEAVVLEASTVSYTFNNEQYADYLSGSLFTISKDHYNLKTSYDAGTKTLTFKISADPNLLVFSPAPSKDGWAEGTKWFSIHNNRNNKGYLSTQDSDQYLDDAGTLTIKNGADASGNRGGLWAFVPQDGGGFNIYNNAYGPDFILGVTGTSGSARLNMYQKDAVPSGVSTLFTHGENSSRDGGANIAYYFRIGLTGSNHLNEQGGYAGTWAPTGGNANKCESDQGSAFTITAVSDDDIAALQTYDVYKVATTGVTGYTGIDYTPMGNTFGKRSTAKNNDILILKAGSEIAAANFVPAPTDYVIATATSSDDATHYYKYLTLNVRDVLATDKYTIKVTDGTQAADLDVDAVDVRYAGPGIKNGENIYTRPTEHPKAADFVVNGMENKFVWGPVIDKTAKTITFDIRDVATEFHTGLYQMMLLDEAKINTVDGYIDMFAGDNLNTSSKYLYIAPSVYGKDGAKFKFTGIPTYASEAATSVYLTDNGNGTLNLEATGGAKFENVAYNFDADSHILTLTGYGPKDYGYDGNTANFEPKEMPQLTNQNGPTRYYLYVADTTPYDYYFVDLVNGSGTTTVKYNKPSLTGTTSYADNSLLVVKKGTQFTLTDFSPSDTRVLGIEITAEPTSTTPGTLTITLQDMRPVWTALITNSDASLDITGYKVKFKGAEYESGSTFIDPSDAELHEAISTTCSDQFVWGPIVDEDNKTITFDIRPVPATLEPGFYQFMLIEDPDNSNSKNRANVAEINARIKNNGSSSINTTGSYIYVMPPYKETSYLAKYNGIPSYGAEPTTFFHITEVGTTAGKLSIQNVKGYYSHDGGRADKTATTTAGDLASYTFNAGILGLQRWVPGGYWGNTNSNGPSNAAEGPGVAAGDNGVYHEKYYITKVDISGYDVYRLAILDESDASVVGTVTCASNLGAPSVITGGYFFFPKDTPISASLFKPIGSSFEGVSADADAEGIKTITFRAEAGLQNMIVHRQHGVFDQLEATPADLRPTSTNYIQVGDGMLDQPYRDTFTGSGYIPNDMTMQNTSVFHIYQYVIPGQQTQVVLPFTKSKGGLENGGNQSHISNYQRWYNYMTERPLDDDIIRLPIAIDTNHQTALGNTADYYRFDNGHSNWGVNASGQVVRQQAVLGNAYLNFPADADSLLVAVDASEFKDSNASIGNGNLLEPSLNERVVFHLIDANRMSSKLTPAVVTDGNVVDATTAVAGKKLWWEDHTFYVPRIKRGTNDYDNNADLLPLNLAWPYYFVPNSTTGAPMPLLAESQDWNEDNTNRESLYDTLKGNVLIEVEGSAAPYLEVGLFQGQYGLGDTPYITTNHFLYYMMKGEENRTSGERSVPDGSQAVIKVYGKNDAGTFYQLARFTLNFISDAEPLAITSVYGQNSDAPISHRSEDFFNNSGYTRVAELTFQNKSVQFDTNTMESERKGADPERDYTYAFPIDFRRTSYGYSPQNTYGQYKIGTMNYGITYGPAELYRKNIQNPSSTAVKLADDYLFYIDAAETPGQVASVPLEGTLCAGTRLYCYGYIGSTNYWDNTANQVPASVVLNLVGRKTSGPDAGETKIIASYLPGMISDVAYTNDGTTMRSLAYGRTPSMQKAGWRQDGTTLLGPWQQIGFNFIISEEDSHYDEFELQIINNCHSTAGGDYLLDDFTVYANPPRAKMEFSAPLCYDHIPHLKITAPYDLLNGAQKVGGTGADKDNYRISYCFLDHDKYADALETATTEEAKKAAFYNALMGNRTASDTYADGRVTQYRSFWNLSVASTDAGYEAYPDYTFQSALEATSSDVTPEQAASQFATVQAAVFKQTEGSERQVVFSTEIGNALGWEVGKDYDLVFAGGWVTGDFTNAANPYNLSEGVSHCSYFDTFKVRPSIIVHRDMEDADYTSPTACEGQSVSMSVSLPGLGPDGKSTYLQFMQYDWWIGYGQTVKGGDQSTITPATVHNFNQEKFGTYLTATAEHAAGDPVYLITALKNFRRLYPTAIDLRVCPPAAGKDGLGQDVNFTQEEWNCIDHFVQPDANARTPLILGCRAIDFLVRAEDADADKNVYVTIIPIEPLAPFDGAQNVIYCPDPQEVAIRIESAAPHMFNGFTALHDEYPSQMHAVPVRMGLDQFEATHLNSSGQIGDHHLRIPLRGIRTVNDAAGTGAKITKRKYKKVQATDADTYQDLIYLVGTDDPRYSDPNSDDFFIESVDEVTGSMTFRPVGLVRAYNAPTTGDAHMEIGFANNFQPHEGFTYTLKFMFQESIPESFTGATVATCPGAFTFDLKIVPKFIQWTADEGHSEWTNDRNWARADRDVLHAAATASDNSKPLASYTGNDANYAGDQLYTILGDAHGFVPMYFTNVLMHDGTLLPPTIYAHTLPTKDSNGNPQGFIGGLNESGDDATTTRFIKYDMLVTPIAETGFWSSGSTMTPLDYGERYGATGKNYGCEIFDSNICDGLTFEPGTMMYDTQHLTYNKAWVEYELETNRWYTLASPLQETMSGEWYSPEAGGRQLTPHFYKITYNEALNDRFNPAYYQRSWDKAGEAWIYRMTEDEGTYIGFEHDREKADVVRVQKPTYLNWSYVYNDVSVNYSEGGFSINAHYTDAGKDADGSKVLVRMPKDDATYDYYQSEASANQTSNNNGNGNGGATTDGKNPDGSEADTTQPGTVPGADNGNANGNGNGNANGTNVHHGDVTQVVRTDGKHYRLMSDFLKEGPSLSLTAPTIPQTVTNRQSTNPYFLLGNPFMAPMDMDAFFAAQKCKRTDSEGQKDDNTFVSGKYWILSSDKQLVSIKQGDSWINTDDDASAGVIAPLQGFFVQMPVNAQGYAIQPDADPTTAPGSVNLVYTASMQKPMVQIGEDATGKPVYGFANGEDGNANPIYGQKPQLKAPRRSAAVQRPIFRITATNDGKYESSAVVYFSESASNGYNTAEDAETLLDGNIADKVSTVFTSADEQALSINSMSTSVTTIPVGVVAPKDDTRTTLRFTGIDQLSAVMEGTPHLYDAANDTFQVLDDDTAITVTGTTAGRYFIVSGMTLPFAEEAEEEATEDEYDGKAYNLHGIRVRTPQQGTITIRGSRKEYAK